jgi:hypothetical protein
MPDAEKEQQQDDDAGHAEQPQQNETHGRLLSRVNVEAGGD